MRKLGLSTAIIGAGLLATGLAANAQFFNYSATFTPTSTQVAGPGGNYGYNITNGSNTTGISTPTNITLGTIVTNAPAGSTSTVSVSANYSIALALTLTDANGNNAGLGTITKTFSSELLAGTVSGNSAFINNTINPGSSIQTFSFANGSNFTVTYNSYTAPGAPLSGTPGAFGASVVGNSVVFATPEPGAVALLSGLGLPGILMAVRRRRRRI